MAELQRPQTESRPGFVPPQFHTDLDIEVTPALMFKDGKPLIIGGQLAMSPNCCCGAVDCSTVDASTCPATYRVVVTGSAFDGTYTLYYSWSGYWIARGTDEGGEIPYAILSCDAGHWVLIFDAIPCASTPEANIHFFESLNYTVTYAAITSQPCPPTGAFHPSDPASDYSNVTVSADGCDSPPDIGDPVFVITTP